MAQSANPQAQSDANALRDVKFGATIEGYYEYNWNRPPDRSVILRALASFGAG